MHQSVAKWSKDRRYDAAIRRVLEENWTQAESAEHYGIARTHLNLRVKQARAAHEEKMGAARQAVAALKNRPAKRKLPPFKEWWERYFSQWMCPDCSGDEDVHHEMPAFHDEIVAAAGSDARRVVINIPPYHSKSTLLTVWWVVYKICENPSIRIGIISKSGDLAKDFLRQVKQILTDPLLYEGAEGNLIEEYGPFQFEGQSTWNDSEIYVAGRQGAEKDPTVLALGWGSQIYGRRFDIIIMDDIATVDNQTNPESVVKMLEKIDKEVASRVGRSGKLIWVGTRVKAGDIYSVLHRRPGYKVVRYPLIMDDTTEKVLWPEHFPYEQALIHRVEMKPADFQLVYQNVDMPGAGASWTEQMIEECKDLDRVAGQWDPRWRMIGGLDPGGAQKRSGYTAFTVVGIDLETGKRFLVDTYAELQMKSPEVKKMMLEWAVKYRLHEWRVEANGLQHQIYQYDIELVKALQVQGVRVEPHNTNNNKWDPQFGVESMAPLWNVQMVSVPWGNAPSQQRFQPLLDQLLGFPMAPVSDMVMSLWFADLGARQLLNRAHMPMFENRLSKRWSNRVKRKRKVVDFSTGEVRGVPMSDQRFGHLSQAQRGYRRMTVGQPTAHHLVEEFTPEQEEQLVNIPPHIWKP